MFCCLHAEADHNHRCSLWSLRELARRQHEHSKLKTFTVPTNLQSTAGDMKRLRESLNNRAEPPSIHIFMDFQGLIRVYGFTIKNLWDFQRHLQEGYGLLFHYFYRKTSHKLPKNCAQCAIMLSSHGHFKFSWNDDTKYGK